MKFVATAIILLVSPLYSEATSADVPDPPVIKSISCNEKDGVINWEPRGDNGAPIRRYDIQYNTSFSPELWLTVDDNRDVSSSNLTYIAHLPPGVSQSFRVTAWNKIGPSSSSHPSENCTTNPDVPYKNPIQVSGVGSRPDNLIIHWNPLLQIEHNGPGLHYRVYWKRAEEQTFNVHDVMDGKESSLVIENQPTYQLYHIKVQAVNELGAANIEPVLATGHSGEDKPLLAPANFKLERIVSPTSALFTWDAVPPDSLRGQFRGYEIVRRLKDTGDRREIVVSPFTREALLTNLVPFETNYVHMYVFNDIYDGPPSETIRLDMPEGAPGQISSLDARPLGPSALYLSWKEPEYPNGVITGYNIYYAQVNGTSVDKVNLRIPPINEPNQRQAKLAGLIPNTVYRVYVTAVNAAGESPKYFTEITTTNTEPSEPSVPNFKWELLAVGEDTADVKITWLPNFDGNPGSYFYVQYKKENDSVAVKTESELWEDYTIVKEVELDYVYEFALVAFDDEYETRSAVQKVYVGTNGSKTRE